MTVPTPREAASDGVLGFVAESLRRLEDSVARGFRDVNQQLGDLPRQYVPRPELDRRFDEITIDLGRVEAHARRLETEADDAEQRRQKAADDAEAARRSAHRWLVTTAITALSALAGVVGGITVHFH